MNRDVRIPKQKRSIEKREKIIESAFQLFMDNGYNKTSTVDIVKAAGLSVGVFYSYFTDKKDILMVCLERFGNGFIEEVKEEIVNSDSSDNIEDNIKKMLYVMVKCHTQKRQYHDEVKALEFLDQDVKNHFARISEALMDTFQDRLLYFGYSLPYPNEQSLLIHQMIEGIEDELVFRDTPEIDRDILINQCAITIKKMLVK